MIVSKRAGIACVISSAIFLAGFFSFNPAPLAAETPGAGEGVAQTGPDSGRPVPVCEPSTLGSPYIPVDSWIYPAVLRLYGLGYIDTVFLGMRPWTRRQRRSHARRGRRAHRRRAGLSRRCFRSRRRKSTKPSIANFTPTCRVPAAHSKATTRIESIYSASRAITGTPLDDSFHLGQTVINDYGRPFENGFNNYSGVSGYAIAGRFTLYLRGELQFCSVRQRLFGTAGTGSLTGTIRFRSSILPPDSPTIRPPFPWDPSIPSCALDG